MIRYQQAYQAAAQVVGVVHTLFETLLNATAR
jgi:flagellar hook-associated protein FlgK